MHFLRCSSTIIEYYDLFFFFFFKPNPPKTKFLGEFMINFFIQNFIPFLVPSLFLLGLRNIEKKKKERVGNQAGPCGTFSEKPSQRNPSMFPASCLALLALQVADSSSNDENNTVIGLLVPPE